MRAAPKRSDYKTGKEYRWAKKAQAKDETVVARTVAKLIILPLVAVWIITGSLALGILAGVGIPLVLVGMVWFVKRGGI